ncbi:hypothetical protein NC652_000024 [Populus alba x Populus x berolinensis]|nr:hypothetical protein NC652_000024 [Populus alba x Populus x berolinensis]
MWRVWRRKMRFQSAMLFLMMVILRNHRIHVMMFQLAQMMIGKLLQIMRLMNCSHHNPYLLYQIFAWKMQRFKLPKGVDGDHSRTKNMNCIAIDNRMRLLLMM